MQGIERLAAYITLSAGRSRFVMAVVAGALAALMMPPFAIIATGFLAFPVLVWLLDGASGDPDRGFFLRLWPSFLTGWAFGFGYFVAGLWWTGNALLVEADAFAWALPLAVLGLPAYLALYYGLAAALARLFWTDGWVRILALAGAFGLAEWARGVVLTGFPWNAIGQALMPFPVLMQSLTVVGSHTMDVAAVLIFAAPALIATGRGMRFGVGLAILLVVAHVGFGFYRMSVVAAATASESARRIVRLVQPAIDQSAKLDDQQRGSVFAEHLALTTAPPEAGAKRPDYIVWPETSIPFILTQNPDALVQIADALEDGQVLIAGAVRTETDSAGQPPRYYNSAYVIDSQGQIIGASDKVHLVPFGEYLPFEEFWKRVGLTAIAAMPGGYSAASQHNILVMPDGLKLLPLICYEVIFPDETARAAGDVDAIVNLTNDGWFGYTPGPWQHFFQARLRAVETGLPVIRNANNGISALIGPRGDIGAGLDFQSKGYVDVSLPTKIVPVLNSNARELNFWLLLGLVALIVFCTRLRLVIKQN
jgi:apolipoprotein N-acyltransferase